jgi:soluble lytic murein transglycosylase-like protein
MACEVNTAIAATNADHYAKIDAATRMEYSFYIAEASHAHGLDPLLVTAVAWHESNFRNLDRNATNDYGLMQVHWQRLSPAKGEDWLVGLKPRDLLDPRTNIHAGCRELAYYRDLCKARKHRHRWWSHYRYGPSTVGPTPYGRRVWVRFKKLEKTSLRGGRV